MQFIRFWFALSLTLTITTTMSSQKNTDQLQNDIKALTDQGQFKSAIELLDALVLQARKEDNAAIEVLGIWQRAQLTKSVDERRDLAAIEELYRELEVAETDEVLSMIHLALAGHLRERKQRISYMMADRTYAAANRQLPVEEWDLQTLEEATYDAMTAFLGKADVLRDRPLGDYKALIEEGKNMEHLYPTVYDLALHHGIGLLEVDPTFSNADLYPAEEWIDLVQPRQSGEQMTDDVMKDFMYKFLIEAQLDYEDADPLLYTLYQKLSNTTQSNKITPEDKASFEQLIEGYITQYAASQEVTLMHHLLGQSRLADAGRASSLDERKAAASVNKAVLDTWKVAAAEHPKSYGSSILSKAIIKLERPSLSLQAMEHVRPDQSILLRIDHKRTPKVVLKLTQLTEQDYLTYRYGRGRREDFVQGMMRVKDAARTAVLELPDHEDYMEYSSEHLIDGVSAGIYLLWIDTDSAISRQQHAVVMVSDMMASYHQQQDKHRLVVMDRQTGTPTQGVTVELHNMKYREARLGSAYSTNITDDDGMTSIKLPSRGRRPLVRLSHGQQVIYLENLYGGWHNGHEQGYDRIVFYTDRAIYRPGQTIHFSGIVHHREGHAYPRPSGVRRVTVDLIDMNGQKVSTKELSVDDYGAIYGSFDLPDAGLNGQYTLSATNLGSAGIQVEAYKRPSFKIDMQPITGQMAFGAPLTITGTATTYAGPSVEDGKVTYRIYRSFYRPYWCGANYDFFMPPWWGSDDLVASGEEKTNDSGQFDIPFTPEEVTGQTGIFSASYRVEVDVLDEKGETQTTTYTFYVSNKQDYIVTNMSSRMSVEAFDTLEIKVQNVMQQPTTKQLTWQLDLLQPPGISYLPRPWQWTDHSMLDTSALARHYPVYSTDGQHGYLQWEVAELWSLATGQVTGTRAWSLPSLPSAGIYRLTILDDQDSVIMKQHIEVYSFDEMKAPTADLITVVADQSDYAPGDEAQLLIGQAIAQTPVLVEIIRQQGEPTMYWMIPSEDRGTISIPVTDEDYGGVMVRLTSVRHGHSASQRYDIQVPYRHKELKVELSTMRDETLPGSDESWEVRIRDASDQPIAARLLAAMYDQSLDQFVQHRWSRLSAHAWYPNVQSQVFGQGTATLQLYWPGDNAIPVPYQVPRFKYMKRMGGRTFQAARVRGLDDAIMMKSAAPASEVDEMASNLADQAEALLINVPATAESPSPPDDAEASPANFNPRTNLQETVFFYPDLASDEAGKVTLDFTMNEALTTWRLQLMAWDEELAMGYAMHDVVTKKDLMVFPQLPRFMRQGDQLQLTARVNKLVDKALDINTSIDIIDVVTGDTLTADWVAAPTIALGKMATSSTLAKWDVKVPSGAIHPVKIIVKAWSGDHVDGEVHELPIISSKKLITATLPLYAHGGQTKSYSFDALAELDKDGRQPLALTVEYMDNPAWLAVQSLPYLTNYSNECSEQIAHRIFANALSAHILDQIPEVERMLKTWKADGERTSPLKDDQELKNILIEHTPWLRDAIDEEADMAAMYHLFDRNRVKNALQADVKKLMNRQQPDGGFTWYGGHRPDRYTTQLVLEIFGRLRQLGVELPRGGEIDAATSSAFDYLHEEIQKAFHQRSNNQTSFVSNTDLHALYVYAMYTHEAPWKSEAWTAILTHGKNKWVERNLYTKAMMVVGYHRLDPEDEFPAKVLASLEDIAHRSEELGTHWIYHKGYAWHQRPIEAQSMMIEAFYEMGAQKEVLDPMRLWLLKHKQTNRWSSTVATGRAVYALLMQGSDWLAKTQSVDVSLGGQVINFDESAPGTGYRKTRMKAGDISSAMANVQISNPNEVTSWGALYYQYLQDADQVEAHSTEGMSLRRELMLQRAEGGEMRLESLEDVDLAVGDRVTVRLTFKVDRIMSYLHIEDMRPSGVSPTEQLSRYQYQEGIGYYQTSSDLATHFFIDHAYPGTYVLEYDTWVNLEGDYSAGLATVQCMYAPEYTAQSGGSRLLVGRQ